MGFYNRLRRQTGVRLEIGDRPFDICPRRVLREDRTKHHFKGGIGWPPVLRAVTGKQFFIDL